MKGEKERRECDGREKECVVAMKKGICCCGEKGNMREKKV